MGGGDRPGMIRFFITADSDLPTLAYNMTKFMNSVTRNGGLIISTHVVRDVNPLLTGVVFYSETKKERVRNLTEEKMEEAATQ